ncbi:hypothetical protein BHE74_00027199 [Ensete ventricosum]|nr:hypothetical protein GW17_00013930 [Ensete ventricosum]RWW65488.1 hypothetical protein BHE74_00027199 [Ensete ventricosum]RZR80299.1 hypothetical protein BHM03_00006287 [Ensete ventricosum]
MASQRNPNTDPDDLVDGFSNCMGGTCTGGGGGGEGVAFPGKGATFTGLAVRGLTLGASEGLGARGGVMNTVYLPALPITGGGSGASRGSAAAMAVVDEEEDQEKEGEGPAAGRFVGLRLGLQERRRRSPWGGRWSRHHYWGWRRPSF